MARRFCCNCIRPIGVSRTHSYARCARADGHVHRHIRASYRLRGVVHVALSSEEEDGSADLYIFFPPSPVLALALLYFLLLLVLLFFSPPLLTFLSLQPRIFASKYDPISIYRIRTHESLIIYRFHLFRIHFFGYLCLHPDFDVSSFSYERIEMKILLAILRASRFILLHPCASIDPPTMLESNRRNYHKNEEKRSIGFKILSIYGLGLCKSFWTITGWRIFTCFQG